jgi:hypothetical protein
LACPFFVPLEIISDGSWPHPSRLPLGAGWRGNCGAATQEKPASEDQVRDFCNLGYASACPHLPLHREWDAIRFSIAQVSPEHVTICFVCELAHAPVESGNLTFDLAGNVLLGANVYSHVDSQVDSQVNSQVDSQVDSHNDPRVVRLATSYLQTYRARHSTC